MANIESTNRGRSSNVDLNLVPFIDLMSVLITFLLISAVWTQISMIQLGASFASPQAHDIQLNVPPLEDLVLRVDLVANGYILKFGKETKPIPKIKDSYDVETLLAELLKVKKKYPDKPGIKISVSDSIKYEHMIKVMDIGLQAGFSPELLTGGP